VQVVECLLASAKTRVQTSISSKRRKRKEKKVSSKSERFGENCHLNNRVRSVQEKHKSSARC
jgi:hypothetical protein